MGAVFDAQAIGLEALAGEELPAAGTGLDPDKTFIQYLCQTGPDEHDPAKPPDAKVRPEHAALHGTVWRLDDPSAPIPPTSWGCRCAIRYVAAPDSPAAKAGALPPAPTKPVTSTPAVFRRYLDAEYPDWKQVAAAMQAAPAGHELAAGYKAAKARGWRNPREAVRIVAQAGKPPRAPKARPAPAPAPVDPAPAPAPAPATPLVRTLRERAEAARPVAEQAWGKATDDWTPEQQAANRTLGRAAANQVAREVAPLRRAVRAAYDTFGKAFDANDEAGMAAAAKAIGDAEDQIATAIAKAIPSPVRDLPAWKVYIEGGLPTPGQAAGVARFGRTVSATSGWDPSSVVAYVEKPGVRGWATGNTRLKSGKRVHTVHVSEEPNRGTVVHELAHTLEWANPRTQDAARAFLLRRTKGAALVENQPGEFVRAGGFFDPYVGRDYSTKGEAPYADGTEVVSMGVEALAHNPAMLLAKDPQHFMLALKAAMGAL